MTAAKNFKGKWTSGTLYRFYIFLNSAWTDFDASLQDLYKPILYRLQNSVLDKKLHECLDLLSSLNLLVNSLLETAPFPFALTWDDNTILQLFISY